MIRLLTDNNGHSSPAWGKPSRGQTAGSGKNVPDVAIRGAQLLHVSSVAGRQRPSVCMESDSESVSVVKEVQD